MPWVRLALSVVAAFLFFLAGTQMREQGSGIEFPFGLIAYGAAFAVLSYGVSGFRPTGTPKPTQPRQPSRSFYDDEDA